MINSIGNIYRLTSFGESHGPAIGGVIDGVPSGLVIDTEALQTELDRRRPGTSDVSSRRSEPDKVRLLSGIYKGVTTGSPIGFIIENTDARPSDYADIRDAFRPNHADYTYYAKFGHRDPNGGGRASARETAARVVAGAVALQALAAEDIRVDAYASAIGSVGCNADYNSFDLAKVWDSPVRCPDEDISAAMRQAIIDAASEGDSLGGIVTCIVRGAPAGLGEPVFSRLESMLGAAMLSIPAAKGFDVGLGVDSATARGSQVRDIFCVTDDSRISTGSNWSGGIQGGISNGNDIVMRVFFKPTPTVMQPYTTVDSSMRTVSVRPKGRHDPCVVPRAVQVVRSMAAITMFDALMLDRCRRM